MWLIIKKHTDRFWLVSIRNQVEEHLDLRVLWNFLELIKTSYATTSESEWSVSCVCWCRRKSFLKYFLSLCNVHLTFHLLISFTNQVSTRQLFFSLFPDCTNLKKLIRTPICHEVKHTNHRAPRLHQKQNSEGIKKRTYQKCSLPDSFTAQGANAVKIAIYLHNTSSAIFGACFFITVFIIHNESRALYKSFRCCMKYSICIYLILTIFLYLWQVYSIAF